VGGSCDSNFLYRSFLNSIVKEFSSTFAKNVVKTKVAAVFDQEDVSTELTNKKLGLFRFRQLNDAIVHSGVPLYCV